MTDLELSRRLLSRRATLKMVAGAGAFALIGWRGEWARLFGAAGDAGSSVSAAPGCVVKPQLTEGPFFVDERLNRSDIRSDPMTGAIKPGTPLRLALTVRRLDGGECTPLAGAYVDVWHTDALGSYSDIRSEGTAGQKYLRGYQVTDENGEARFLTIYPGWYRGRTVHIHFKIRIFNGDTEAYEFTSQLFFDQSVTDEVLTGGVYSQRGAADTTNAEDGIYRQGNSGELLLLQLSREGDGYLGTFDISLEGVPGEPTGGGTPRITAATMRGKKLVVTGSSFGSGATILVNGEEQTTRNHASNGSTVLLAPRMSRKIARGETVTLRVRNPDGELSSEFAFTRPAA